MTLSNWNATVASIPKSEKEQKFWDEARKGTCTICGESLNTGKLRKVKAGTFLYTVVHLRCSPI